jgi:N-acetylmuramoyl-L-alanine amidase
MSPAVLVVVALLAAPKTRVFIDPGHGYPGNEGTTTMLCEKEQDVVLEVARDLGERLTAMNKFVVRLARTSSVGATYDRRLADAEKFRAHVLLSIHLDARGWASPVDGCPRNDSERGFGVLFSDRGGKRLVEKRRQLARAIAGALSEREFFAYDGTQYGTLYDFDPTPGVFVDRRSLFMLRRPPMPSVIIETHHGLHREEHEAWKTEETRAKFAAAVAAAVLSLRGPVAVAVPGR